PRGENAPGLAALEQERMPLVVAGEEPHGTVAVPALECIRLVLGLVVRPEDLQHRRRPVRALDPHGMAANTRDVRLARAQITARATVVSKREGGRGPMR